LITFERSQAIFEDDLARLIKERTEVSRLSFIAEPYLPVRNENGSGLREEDTGAVCAAAGAIGGTGGVVIMPSIATRSQSVSVAYWEISRASAPCIDVRKGARQMRPRTKDDSTRFRPRENIAINAVEMGTGFPVLGFEAGWH
jgi:hypothetical protein